MINIIDSITKNLGYNQLRKVDPNTQDIKDDEKVHGTDSLAQAAIPAVLIGLFNRLQDTESAAKIIEGDSINWMSEIFGNKTDMVIDKIAAYAKAAPASTKQECEHIAHEAIRLMRQNISGHENFAAVSAFVKQQRTEVLKYLPAALQIGDLVNNNNIDDRTNKMEGPISDFMHTLEKAFNSSN
ncbi:MAG: hypothetical protein JST75_05865 [Bacteroidetes bacterium]|nr:hypothetical protein [Bacteroidota bacterium]